MATSAHSIPLSLPWQDPTTRDGLTTWRLYLAASANRDAAQVATLTLFRNERSGRYSWLITPAKEFTAYVTSRGPGWLDRVRAEAAMLRALADVLHGSTRLPTSLPPAEGGISVCRQGR